MSHHSQGILTPTESRKRRERESMLAGTEEMTALKPPAPPSATKAVSPPALDNRLLAGYMAYEFLTRGTLLGQRLDSARVGAAEPKRLKAEPEQSGRKENGSYCEVACILKMEGVHVPGIVNPTQLTRWIQM